MDMTSFLFKFKISSLISVVLVPILYGSATLLVPAQIVFPKPISSHLQFTKG